MLTYYILVLPSIDNPEHYTKTIDMLSFSHHIILLKYKKKLCFVFCSEKAKRFKWQYDRFIEQHTDQNEQYPKRRQMTRGITKSLHSAL